MEFFDLLERTGRYAGVAGFLGLALLIPLYISQSRDVRRLRLWSEYAPEAPEEAEQAAATEIRLAHEAAITQSTTQAATERAERRAARRATRPAAAMGPATAPPSPAGRAAPAPGAEGMAIYREPRWRTWVRRGPNTRELLLVMAGAFLIGVLIVVGSQVLLTGGDDADVSQTAGGTSIVKEDVEVAVLNGTAVLGLAARVGDDLEANGFGVGAVTNSETPTDETVVLYERGHEEEARVVARDLGVSVVQLIDPESRAIVEGADVVVVAGEDRAQ